MSVNTTIATAILLIVLGVGGVFSTGAITATILPCLESFSSAGSRN